jgi:aquaporin Z
MASVSSTAFTKRIAELYYGAILRSGVLAGEFAVGGVSGRSFTPRSPWSNFWIYLVADFLGGAAAGITFKSLVPEGK